VYYDVIFCCLTDLIASQERRADLHGPSTGSFVDQQLLHEQLSRYFDRKKCVTELN
jgi:hypothetical protein